MAKELAAEEKVELAAVEKELSDRPIEAHTPERLKHYQGLFRRLGELRGWSEAKIRAFTGED